MRGQDDMNPIVIIGSGLSGYTVASEYRKLDQQRDMLLISQDDGSAYAKPILSNALAQNKSLEQLTSTPAEEMARRLNMTVLTRQTVLAIDARLQTIRTSSGELFYGDLVLALGADTVRLAIAGDGVQNMLSVNDLADYARFRAIIEGTRRILIMGAGLIGCEFANDLLHGGICPIVVDPNPWPLASLAPMAVGTALMQDLETAGVQWQLGNKVQRIDRAAQGYAVTLMDGTQLEVDAVLSAVGLKPRTTLAQAAGIATDKGILVNRYGQASSRRTYALGDCAQYTNGTLMPFVRPALIAARAIAATLAGSLSPIEFPSMPIMIKTPAHPVVVQPPHPATQGEWSQQFHTDGQQWLFRDNDQRLLGFAVSGGAAKSHARLTKLLGSVWTEA